MVNAAEFLLDTQYELQTVGELMSMLSNVVFSEHEIGGKAEVFVPALSVRSTADINTGNMIADEEDKVEARKALKTYFDGIKHKNSDYTVAGIFRVGGMTEKMLEQERDIEACRKAGVPDSDLPPIPIPSSGAHYVAATLHHKKDGTSELVIIDPLGEKGEVNRSYQQEIQVIEDGFKERFNITSVKRNQGNVIFQSDHNSCGAACVFNLETQLNGSRPKEGELGIENNRGKLQFEPGAAVLRFNQKENLEKADALIREKVKEPIKVVVKEEIPQQSPTISVKDINKKLTEIEMQDEKALQEAIALSLNPNRQVDQDVIKSQQKILDQFSLIKGKNAGNLNPSQTPPIAENPSRKRKER